MRDVAVERVCGCAGSAAGVMSTHAAVGGRRTDLPTLPHGARVCIVGAGSVGVYCAKTCVEVGGWQPTVYEAAASLGGVWRAGKHWDSLTTNSSWRLMEVGDFPFPFQPSGPFPTRGEIVKYVEAYAAHFDILRHIRFGTRVLSVVPTNPDDPLATKWTVTARGPAGNTETSVFDAVFCCTGQYNTPLLPPALRTPREAGYEGEVVHSHRFGSGERCKGKRVLVVGLGNSALDVALECIKHGAASVATACRRGAHLLPVSTPAGAPRDELLLTRWFEHHLPSSAKQYQFFAPIQRVSDAFAAAGMPRPAEASRRAMQQRISNVKQWRLWMEHLRNKKLRIHPSGVKAIGPGRNVTFYDGSTVEADVIVACTGYEVTFPFLDEAQIIAPTQAGYSIAHEGGGAGGTGAGKQDGGKVPATNVRWMCLYRRVMHPVYPTLGFFSQLSTLGNEAAVGELQARWMVSMLHGASGTARPTVEDMVADTAAMKQRLLRTTPLVPGFVSYVKYCDMLAADIGAAPPQLSASLVLRDPRLAWQLLMGPVVPAQYVLTSRDSKKAAIADRLVRNPTTIPPSKL